MTEDIVRIAGLYAYLVFGEWIVRTEISAHIKLRHGIAEKENSLFPFWLRMLIIFFLALWLSSLNIEHELGFTVLIQLLAISIFLIFIPLSWTIKFYLYKWLKK